MATKWPDQEQLIFSMNVHCLYVRAFRAKSVENRAWLIYTIILSLKEQDKAPWAPWTSWIKLVKWIEFQSLTCFESKYQQRWNSSTVRGYPPDWMLCQRQPLYTHTTDKLMTDFHCLELNKVLKSRGNPVGLKYLL